MFKKVMLVVLLLLLPSLTYALDYIDVTQVTVETQIVNSPVNLPTFTPLQLKETDLLVEAVANIPEDLKNGSTFWVDIYVTPGGAGGEDPSAGALYSAIIKLVSSDPAIADFNGLGENGNLFGGSNTYVSGLFSHSSFVETKVKPLARYKLGRLQMQAKARGTISITVDKANSSATWDQVDGTPPFVNYYTLVINPTIITKVANNFCVPLNITCPEEACGFVPNGCGGLIKCDCTACAEKHNCQMVALFPQVGDKQLCEAAINSAGADKDALKGISNAFQNKTMDGQPFEGCTAASCKFLKLNAFITTLTTWFGKQ